MSVVPLFRNCSPLCAEHLGGNCPGESCPFAPAKQRLDGSTFSITFTHDELLDEINAADLRGFRRGSRFSLREFRHGFKLGFGTGVIAMFGLLLILALIQWVAR